ncbi:MAG: hypothetical protein KatS3mg103_0369 [Phycisphaerales bacterium]|nr:MAG: hypothetical protein KatS3mg103_0369 [Phycisphaerales bacterium]
MLHAAARGQQGVCFVEPEARLPFMLMDQAIDATLALARAERPSRRVYNVASFAPSAGQIAQAISRHFPGFTVRYEVNPGRSAIVSSWPADVDRSAAVEDLGLALDQDFETVLAERLVPAVRKMYGS